MITVRVTKVDIRGPPESSLTAELYCGVIQIRYQNPHFRSDAGLAAAIILGPLTILALLNN